MTVAMVEFWWELAVFADPTHSLSTSESSYCGSNTLFTYFLPVSKNNAADQPSSGRMLEMCGGENPWSECATVGGYTAYRRGSGHTCLGHIVHASDAYYLPRDSTPHANGRFLRREHTEHERTATTREHRLPRGTQSCRLILAVSRTGMFTFVCIRPFYGPGRPPGGAMRPG